MVRFRFRRDAGSARSVGVLLAVFGLLATVPAAQAQDDAPRYVPNHLIVQFQSSATSAQIADALAQGKLKVKKSLKAGPSRQYLLTTDTPADDAKKKIEKHPAVAFAEFNWVVTHQAVSNDPGYTGGNLWGMYGDGTTPANAYGSQAGEAWAAGHTGSSNVYVGVIDEGIDFTHPDLAANIWTNPFDPADGQDNDGNGYVDDIHGWDCANNDNDVFDGGPGDSGTDAHGTHVAGTIGARGGNGVGVAGVNWNVTIISLKFLNPYGGTTADAVEALNYLIDLKTRGLNIVAANNSWGGGGYSQALHNAIIRAAKAGILFIAAAGNSGRDNDRFASYPANYNTMQGTSTESAASYDGVIAVAALTSSGGLASWSNYGKTTVDLAAPGASVLSTTPNNTYSSYSGTSMATPHVTGAVALYVASNPGKTGSQIKSAILGSTVATSALVGSGKKARQVGNGGRLNVSGF